MQMEPPAVFVVQREGMNDLVFPWDTTDENFEEVMKAVSLFPDADSIGVILDWMEFDSSTYTPQEYRVIYFFAPGEPVGKTQIPYEDTPEGLKWGKVIPSLNESFSFYETQVLSVFA